MTSELPTPDLSPSSRWQAFLSALLMCAATYSVITLVPILSPFSPTIPYHIDFWVYFNAMQRPLTVNDFLQGRPLALVMVRLMGASGMNELQSMLFLSFLSFVGIASTLLACEAIAQKPMSNYLRALYVFLAMTTSTFFVVHQWDFGGVVATIFFSLALVAGARPTGLLQKAMIVVLLWLSYEFKPTWMAAAPMVFAVMWLCDMSRRKDALLLVFVSCAVGFGILAKDYALGSPFVAGLTADSAHPYAIGRISQIASAFYSYTVIAFAGGGLAAVLFTVLFFRFNVRVLLVTQSAALGALIPIATLAQNHFFAMYAWYGSLFVLGALAAAEAPRWRLPRLRRSWRYLDACVALLAIVAFAAVSIRYIDTVDRGFYLGAQKTIEGDLEAIQAVASLPPGKTLLVGPLTSPFSPFNVFPYVDRKLRDKVRMGYLMRKEWIWTQYLIPPVTPLKASEFAVTDYDFVLDFTPPFGRTRLMAVGELSPAAQSEFKSFLLCPGFSKLRYQDDSLPQRIAERDRCKIGEGG